MLGKTFKGMTDEMLAWQTERFTELAVEPETIRDSYVVPAAARAGRRDRLRRPAALHPLPRRPGPALRPGRPLPRRQARRRGRHHRDRARPWPPGRFADVIELKRGDEMALTRDDGAPLGRLTMGLGWDKKPGAGVHPAPAPRTSTSTRRRSSTPATSCSTWRSSTTSRPATGRSSTSATTSAAAARATTSRSRSTWPRSTHASTRCCSWSAATRATRWSGSHNAYCRLGRRATTRRSPGSPSPRACRAPASCWPRCSATATQLAAPGDRPGHRGHGADRVPGRPAALRLSRLRPAPGGRDGTPRVAPRDPAGADAG